MANFAKLNDCLGKSRLPGVAKKAMLRDAKQHLEMKGGTEEEAARTVAQRYHDIVHGDLKKTVEAMNAPKPVVESKAAEPTSPAASALEEKPQPPAKAETPTPKEGPVASPTKSAEPIPPAEMDLPHVATLKPHEVLNEAKNVKLATPKGARFLRVTDSKGRQIVEPIENVTKGANPFHQAGPFKKVESGILNSKKQFVPLKGEITASDANKQLPVPSPSPVLYVEHAGKRYPVSSISEAQSKFDAVRDASNVGASEMTTPTYVLDSAGKRIGEFSYNGRVWSGKPGSSPEVTDDTIQGKKLPSKPTKSPEAASVEKLANAALALHKDSLTALGHPHAFETGETRAGSGIETDVQSQKIRIDPEKLAKATAKMTPAVRAEFVKRAVAQEVIHVGTLKYAAESVGNREKLLGLNDDKELMDRAGKAYGPEWKDQSEFAKAAEAARMLLEGPEKLTEASYKFLKDFLEWMKSKLKNLSKDAREVLDGIRAKLGQYEKSAGETKEQAPPETPEKPATTSDIRAEIDKLKADGDPEGLVPGLERYLAKKEKPMKPLAAATPDDSTPTPGEGAAPSSQQPSESQPDHPSTEGALTTGEHSGAARNEKLMEEAEAAGLSPSLETIKGAIRGDKAALDKLRAMIKDSTGKEAINAAKPEAQTETAQFKKWFGESKVSDRNGNPVAVYHSSPEKFTTFDTSNEGAHFGTMEQAENLRKSGKRTPQSYFLSIQNPLRMPDIGVWSNFNNLHSSLSRENAITPEQADKIWDAWNHTDAKGWETLKGSLRQNGYDGIVYENELEGKGDSYIAFEPNQIKSATKNSGEFDPNDDSTLGAANPLKSMRDTYDSLADHLAARATKKEIAYKQDAVGNLANYHGQQAGDSIRLDLPDKMDREAMPFVIEAGGDKAKMTKMVQKIAASKDPKMAAKFDPIVDHAINNFDRLNKARANHDKIMADSLKELNAAGIDIGEVEDYVTRVLDAPEEVQNIMPNPLFGKGGSGSGNPRYFAKGRQFETLADAIKAGLRPKSTDLADLDAHRIEAGKKVLQQKQLFDQLRKTPSPTDGKPIIGELEERKLLNGKTEMVTPRGYTSINAAGRPIPIHDDFKSIFQNLFGSSAIRTNAAGRALIKAAAVVKHGTLAVDTFHIGRMLFKMATAGGGGPLTIRNGHPAWNIHKGRALLEYTDQDLGRAQAMGDITKKEADYARANRPKVEKLMEKGMNVGKVADNLMEQAKLHLPIVSKLNSWIFGKLSRSAMLQASLVNLDRNLKNPYYTEDQAYRQTAKEMNELFGNLQNQGILQNKTLQDISRLIFLAPNWTESQFRNEARAYAQTAKAPINAARGRGFRIGNSARVFAAGLVALLAANQVINYLTRGKSTFENKEKDHKLDSWIPGGKRGFWFSPLEIAGEYAHAAMKYLAQRENPVDVATHIANNKLSPMARGVKTGLTGRDYSGKHFLNNTDRTRAAITDALPVPMFLAGLPFGKGIEKDPRQPLGFRFNRQPAAGEKQLLQSVGAKVTPAQSAISQMFAIAQPFRADRQTSDAAGEYTELRRALGNDDDKSAKSEIKWLYDRGKTFDQIRSSVGISKSGEIKPENFAGNQDREAEMLSKLKPDDRAIYAAAQREHTENAARLLRIIGSVPSPSSTAASRLPKGVTPYSFK